MSEVKISFLIEKEKIGDRKEYKRLLKKFNEAWLTLCEKEKIAWPSFEDVRHCYCELRFNMNPTAFSGCDKSESISNPVVRRKCLKDVAAELDVSEDYIKPMWDEVINTAGDYMWGLRHERELLEKEQREREELEATLRKVTQDKSIVEKFVEHFKEAMSARNDLAESISLASDKAGIRYEDGFAIAITSGLATQEQVAIVEEEDDYMTDIINIAKHISEVDSTK